MNVDVFAARDQRRRSPSGHPQIGGDRRRKIARVGKNRDGPFAQRLRGSVAAERAADAHFVPCVGHAKAIAAEDIDAVLLTHRAYLARIVHRQLLRDDENLADVLIDANQFGDAVARGGWRQIDDAAIEAMAVRETLAHIVIDRNVADFRLEHLTAASR